MYSPILRYTANMLLLSVLCLLPSNKAVAGLDSCLKAALNTANPDDLKKSAAFAYNHPTCLSNLIPPTLVPYVALSGSLDAANKLGALSEVGLAFGNDYQQCRDNFDPGKTAVKKLAPVLQPVCSALNMDCKMFEGEAADEVNSQLASEVPLLSLLPCSCAAATSGLGVEKIAALVKETKQCGAALAQVGEALGDAAEGVYDVGGDLLGYGGDAAGYALKLGEDIAKSVGSVTCAVSKIWGGCKSTPPSYKTTATAICKAHGSTWWASSKTTGPDDVWVQCNDGLYCWASPGVNLQCEQRRTPTQRNNDIAQMKQWCPQREQELEAGYKLQCHDGWCKVAVTNVASKAGAHCLAIVTSSENNEYSSAPPSNEQLLWNKTEMTYISSFDSQIIQSIQRDPNTTPLQFLATHKCRPFLGREEQSLCEGSFGFDACKKLVDAGKIQKCLKNGGGEYSKPTIAKFTTIINAAAITNTPATTERAPVAVITNGSLLRATPATSATATPSIVVSDVFLANAAQKGCRPYLGRRDELLCENQAGFNECVQVVNRNMLKQCRNAENGEIFPIQLRLQKYP